MHLPHRCFHVVHQNTNLDSNGLTFPGDHRSQLREGNYGRAINTMTGYSTQRRMCSLGSGRTYFRVEARVKLVLLWDNTEWLGQSGEPFILNCQLFDNRCSTKLEQKRNLQTSIRWMNFTRSDERSMSGCFIWWMTWRILIVGISIKLSKCVISEKLRILNSFFTALPIINNAYFRTISWAEFKAGPSVF